ncbi:hypothetical protein VP01_166g5 [Puccinia sorghi]|uniref:Uncharacterized protein n=1 Tax=Puccinia sorghi TaxID=27349 RepID=A0A0L6VG63_9BASI|nr:hypothetical protein VP01_166g5 [Puccinia sorghi]
MKKGSFDDEVSELLIPASSTRALRERNAKVKPLKYSHLTTDPSTFKKALSLTNKDKWIKAVDNELNSIEVAGKVNIFEDLFLLRCPNSSAHDPDTLLGMDLHQTKDSVALSQPKLNPKGLKLLGMEECKIFRTPLSPEISFIASSQEEKEASQKLKINYQSHTGLLNFLACQTRPGLAPVVLILFSFNSNPGIKHWLQLTLQPDKIDSRNATLKKRSICFWKACTVAWNSKKQKNISLSSTEAQLNALSNGVQESQWITYLIEELWKEKLNPTDFNIDNQGLLEKIKNFGSNSKTKHLDIKMNGAESLRRLKERWFLVLFSPN